MTSNIERAEDARQRGNTFYKAYQFSNAIKAYKVAVALTPADPAPLSNLSAVTFETGDYEQSVKFGTDALDLLEGEPGDDPRKQKLLTRLTKAKRYLSELDDSIPKKSLRDAILRLPRYRPCLTNDRAYYPIGHDEPESLYSSTLQRTTKDAQVVSFMFCGVGDARNLLQTIMDFSSDGSNSYNSRKADQRLHMTILDVKPAILARDLILFALLDDISLFMGLSDMEKLTSANPNQFFETLDTVTYFYMASVMPAYAWNRIQATIQRLLDSFDNSKQPIPWVYIPVAVQAAVRPSLEAWKRGPVGPYSTQLFREATLEDYLQTRMSMMSMPGGMDIETQLSFPHLKFDKRAFNELGIVLGHDEILSQNDPKILTIIEAYRNNDRSAKDRLSSHIDKTWKPNVTLVNIVFESENTRPGSEPRPALGIPPFQVLGSLMKGATQDQAILGLETFMTVAENFFMTIGGAIASLRKSMMVEVRSGEMADLLEHIQYQTLDRPTKTESKDFLLSSKWPHKYHVIHMSNVPDYVGGPFTAFLYGAPILEHGPGTGVTACILRNSTEFQSMSQFYSEYLAMYDPALIRSHFQLELAAKSPPNREIPFFAMGYFLWERIQPKPLSFEQLMPQSKFLHWLHTHFLKLCLPYPRSSNPTIVFAPLNMTAFLRLLEHLSGLGYPAHWISNLIDSILSGAITTNARPPSRVVLTTQDVDTVYPTRSFCTKPWLMEFATLIGLWRSIFRVGLVVSSSIPRVDDIIQYTIKFPGLKLWDARAPHSMLVFHNESKFENLSGNLRSILINDERDPSSKSKVIRDNIRCMSTFQWSFKAEEATFWISKDAFEEMKQWKVLVWRTDEWEQEGEGVKLGKAVVKTRCWGEWEDSSIAM